MGHHSSNAEISLVIAALAAVVSLVSLVWNIINSILARTAKLKIELTIVQQMISDPVAGLGKPVPYFNVKITNIGSVTRYVKNPSFTFRRKKELIGERTRRFQVVNALAPVSYPIELPVGKEHNHYASIESFLSKFRGQLKGREKLWIEAEDTHTKKYRSNAVKVAAALTAVEVADKFKSEQ